MSLREELEILEEHLNRGGFTEDDITTVRKAINFVDAIIQYAENQKRKGDVNGE